jgi:predicted O-methyltransferase YrrM
MISLLQKPKIILEIGTFTGYSAICLAKGLTPDGKLYTIENDAEHALLARECIAKSVYADRINLLEGDAKVIIPTLSHVYDLVFIDADKGGYSVYYDMVIDQCRAGALIIADNVLWSGKVIDDDKDKKTQLIHDFNHKVLHDDRVENVIVPIRDGINLIRKK